MKKALIDVDALWRLARIGSPSLSPDGKRICAVVSRYDMQENSGTSKLWLFGSDGKSQAELTTCGDKDSAPAWAPNSKQIAFIAKRTGDEAAQIYLINPDGGEAVRLTTLSTGAFGLRWFPDSKRIAFLSWVWPDAKNDKEQAAKLKALKDSKVKASVIENDHYRYWDHWLTDGRQVHIHTVSLASSKVQDVMHGAQYQLPRTDPSNNLFDIAPDAKTLCFTWSPNAPQRPDVCNKLVSLDLTSKRYTTLNLKDGLSYGSPRFSPDGLAIACTAQAFDQDFSATNHLAVVNRQTRKTSVCLKNWDREVNSDLQWSSDSRLIRFTAEDRGRQHLWQTALDDAMPTCLVEGGTIAEFSQGGNAIAFVRHSTDLPPALFCAHLVDAPNLANQLVDSTTACDSLNAAWIKSHQFGKTQEHWIKGADGDKVQVWVTYPPNFDPKKRYPLMHSIHGGPHTSFGDLWHFRWNMQAFAAQGYVVAGVQYHGSTSFGHAFKSSITGQWGKREALDVEAATDYLIKQGYIDPERLVATGGSYGGYMVGMLNGRAHLKPKQADRYKAYVCHAGCFDWVGMFSDDAYYWHWRELGGYFWNDINRVLQQSPVNYAARFSTPTLVIHGELDYRVPVTQGTAYYNTLRAQGIPARLVYFPDENHWILKPQNSRLWYGEFFDWLKRFVKPGGK